MGHIRRHGATRLLVYCKSISCNHSATLDADWLADDAILLDFDRRMLCTACGHVGAEVRPIGRPAIYAQVRWLTLRYVENVGSQFLSLRQHKVAN